MGDMGFQGGFETMKAGKDEEGWMDMVSVQYRASCLRLISS